MKLFIVTGLLLSSFASFAQNAGTGPGNGTIESVKCGVNSLIVKLPAEASFNYLDAIEILSSKGYEIKLDSPSIQMNEHGFRDIDKLGSFGKLSMHFFVEKNVMQQMMQPSSNFDIEAHLYNKMSEFSQGYYSQQSVYRNTDLVETECESNTYRCNNGKKYLYTERKLIDDSKKILGLNVNSVELEESIIKIFQKFPTCSQLKNGKITAKNYTLDLKSDW